MRLMGARNAAATAELGFLDPKSSNIYATLRLFKYSRHPAMQQCTELAIQITATMPDDS